MNFHKILGSTVIAVSLVLLGYWYLDIRLAELVSQKLGFNFLLSREISNIPDLLLLLVCIVTVASWAARLYLARKPLESLDPSFFEYLGLAVPFSFLLKHFLKEFFGRAHTRDWLINPNDYNSAFHWFQGGGELTGFPSGHMAVLATMMLGIGRFFPQLRLACAGLLFLIALSLILTEYHFFSDVVAGTYVGIIVDFLTWNGISFLRRPGSTTSVQRQ